MAKAVLNYERALLMNPGDADIRFNLEMARSKTVDQVTPTSEVFIVTWVKSLTNCMSESGWGVTAIIAFLLLLAGLGTFYIFGNRICIKENRIYCSGHIFSRSCMCKLLRKRTER